MLSWKIDLDVLEVQHPSDFESAFTAERPSKFELVLNLRTAKGVGSIHSSRTIAAG
jgi:hypothetical protein